MTQPNRVFITGRSALTASGASAEATWNAILEGNSGLEPIKQWDLKRSFLGGELKNLQLEKSLPDRKLVKVISRQDLIGLSAAIQAVENSQLLAYRDTLEDKESFNQHTGVYVGSPGNKYLQQYDFLPLMAKTQKDMQAFAQHLFEEVHPTWLLRILPNNVLAYTGITYGFKGSNHNITNHACGGTQALLEAYQALRTGQAQRAVVVAYDMGIEPQALFYYQKLGVLSDRHLKPFDQEHDGTLLADGAAALILETEASVKARAANCYGELIGGLSATEGSGLFSIESEGQSLANLMERTLETANLNKSDIGLLVAHGNGNKKSDDSEAAAIKAVFPQEQIAVTAFKWSTGHSLTASGVLDAVLTTYALEQHCAPGIASLEQLASSCAALAVSSMHQPIRPQTSALMINRGFASMNACVLIKACE